MPDRGPRTSRDRLAPRTAALLIVAACTSCGARSSLSDAAGATSSGSSASSSSSSGSPPGTGCPHPKKGRVTLAESTPAAAIVVDAANVYWISGDTILKCAVCGCDGHPTVLAAGQDNPVAIAVDATSVYWTNLGASEG